MNQFKDVELVYDSPNIVTLKFYTDMPTAGAPGSLALRKTLSFPATSGRQTKTLPMDDTGTPGAPVEGTQYQVECTSTGIVRLFGGCTHARNIGCWFDGAAGERWCSQPMALGN